MSAFKSILFKDFVTLQRGFDLPSQKRVEGIYPVVASTSITGYHNEYKNQPPGVVTGRSGALGEVQYIKTKFWALNTTLWVKDFKGNYPKYVYYFLKTLDLKRFNSGAGVPTLNRNDLDTLEIKVPPLLTQQKIASILSNYDDLIENNNRRIKILEEMAKTLYQEWFVKFRFPNHQQIKMVESELGLIPEGWEVKKLINICHLIMGQSPKSEFYNENKKGLPFHQGVTNFTDRFPIDKIYCTVSNRIAEARDILFSVRAPVGRINITNKKIIIGRGLCAIRSKTNNQSFLFQQLKVKFSEEDLIGGGTIFKSVTKIDMENIKLINPPIAVVNQFESIINPIFRHIETLFYKNMNLRKTRDLLLPKLISGEIDVENLNINTERLAA